ncbi:MAG: hypothetical protein J6U51_01560 [Bacteroidales bacterium]|nr:hypothetical protein [Bacteroidales bacterium]
MEKATKKEVSYYNIPCSFDIETTSFTDEKGRDTGLMYVWMLGVGGYCIVGREWDEFVECIKKLAEFFETDKDKRVLIYVHNLAWEFQFMRKYFNWTEVFSLSPRTPVYATTDLGIEFRCSLTLTGCGLAKTAESLTMFKIEKLVGDLDYTKLRHSGTPLTDKEIGYCLNDIKIVMALIYERSVQSTGIRFIPLTKTGYVREYVRNACFGEDGSNYKGYRQFIKALTLTPEEYLLLKRGFTGGFTHANPFAVANDKIWYNVRSYDFTSSYPTVMIAEQYPMSKGERIYIRSIEELEKNCKLYCCIFDIGFINLRPKVLFDNYLSISRCRNLEQPLESNGRLVRAKTVVTTLTDVDFEIVKEMYEWDDILIGNFYRYRRGYLPKSIIEAVLKLYNEKTVYKDVVGKEVEYGLAKENVNSCYGMIVTDIIRPELPYKDGWLPPVDPDLNEKIKEYNKNSRRFLFYPWGVWITAYARRNLFSGILEFKGDYLYADTDSIKVINWDRHMDYLEGYNENIVKKLYRSLDSYGIDRSLIHPKTVKGKIKTLGVWDLDGEYKRFKTLGAKRYMYETDKGINITIAGLNKYKAVPFMKDKWDDPFLNFKEGMKIDGEYTGVKTHKYIDDERSGIMTDYLGNTQEYTVLSGIHLSPSEYTLGLSEKFTNYLLNITIQYM